MARDLSGSWRSMSRPTCAYQKSRSDSCMAITVMLRVIWMQPFVAVPPNGMRTIKLRRQSPKLANCNMPLVIISDGDIRCKRIGCHGKTSSDKTSRKKPHLHLTRVVNYLRCVNHSISPIKEIAKRLHCNSISLSICNIFKILQNFKNILSKYKFSTSRRHNDCSKAYSAKDARLMQPDSRRPSVDERSA